MVSNNFLRRLTRNRNRFECKVFLYVGLNQDNLLYQKELAEHFHKSISTVNHHIKKFKEEGLISHHLQLSPIGLELFAQVWDNVDMKKLRAHNIQVRFNLVKCPADFVQRYSKDIFEPITNGKYHGFKGILHDFTFMFYSTNKIIGVFRNILTDDDEEISSGLQIRAKEIQNILEKEFRGIEIGGFTFAKIQTSHIAILDSIIAHKFDEKGFTYEGKEIAVDKSHEKYELELTNPSNNLKEIMSLLHLENRLKEGRPL